MKDLFSRLLSWKTTILGVSALVIPLLVMFNVIEQKNSQGAVESVTTLWDGIIQVVSAIAGLVLVFSHDAPPKV